MFSSEVARAVLLRAETVNSLVFSEIKRNYRCVGDMRKLVPSSFGVCFFAVGGFFLGDSGISVENVFNYFGFYKLCRRALSEINFSVGVRKSKSSV